MNRRMRFDIFENDQIIVFVEQFRGCFSLGYVAENAIGFHFSSPYFGYETLCDLS
jgi:hypothetical protein